MKNKHFSVALLLLLFIPYIAQAQSLNNKIKKSVVEIGDSFTQIPKERLLVLDQVAFKLFKEFNGNNAIDVIIVDSDNQETSQLAMIWLNTGLLYYGYNSMLNVQSAGTSIQSKSLSKLNSLKQFGFKVKANTPESLNIKYGSGSWDVFQKSLESLKPNSKTIEIVVQESVIQNKNTIQLTYYDTGSIAREMLYLATRINNLFKTKQ